jgi:hypothetical protein
VYKPVGSGGPFHAGADVVSMLRYSRPSLDQVAKVMVDRPGRQVALGQAKGPLDLEQRWQAPITVSAVTGVSSGQAQVGDAAFRPAGARALA